jgi:hypothetical protein
MKNWLKIAFLFTCIIIVSVMFSGCEGGICGCGVGYKYHIVQNGQNYYTNEIKEESGCVSFKSDDGDPMKICGTYVIEEDKDYKPPKEKKNIRGH